ncbi:hypothetical protein, partial [Pseudomonas syringae group genomosp. 7]|uniref:hypothetical protein n=1 Tax=Pseudomonas syringae group genomosp. 7 TaxID=251699 RepID=UPI00376F6931
GWGICLKAAMVNVRLGWGLFWGWWLFCCGVWVGGCCVAGCCCCDWLVGFRFFRGWRIGSGGHKVVLRIHRSVRLGRIAHHP